MQSGCGAGMEQKDGFVTYDGNRNYCSQSVKIQNYAG